MFWIIYFILGILISYLFTFLLNKRFSKIFIFSFCLSLLNTVWFKIPGEGTLSPILSIFILESSILIDNGFLRIFRPFGLSFVLIFFVSYIFWKKPKN